MRAENEERRPAGGDVHLEGTGPIVRVEVTVHLRGDWRGNVWFEVPAPVPSAVESVLVDHGAVLDRSGTGWVHAPTAGRADPLPFDSFLSELGRVGGRVVLVDCRPLEPNDLPGEDTIGSPIIGDHSGAIAGYALRLLDHGLDAVRVETLVDMRGLDCVPEWGSRICPNDPCPLDAAGSAPSTCREYLARNAHRLRAGASMVHDGIIPSLTTVGGVR